MPLDDHVEERAVQIDLVRLWFDLRSQAQSLQAGHGYSLGATFVYINKRFLVEMIQIDVVIGIVAATESRKVSLCFREGICYSKILENRLQINVTFCGEFRNSC